MKRSCLTCEFMYGGPVSGMFCRFNPPTVMAIPMPAQKQQTIELAGQKLTPTQVPVQIVSQSPPVPPDYWCGRYQEKEFNKIDPPKKEGE